MTTGTVYADSSMTKQGDGSLKCAIIGAIAAFTAYFAMCAFRRPFMVLDFSGEYVGTGPIELKTALVISQIFGYGLSKFLGISACSQIRRQQMWILLLCLIGMAQGALVMLATLPEKWKLMAMFLNGLPLGMIWGFMVRYLEGRRMSDLMLSVLACSFILGSGVVKDVGRWWVKQDLFSEIWMPAVTGLCFLPPFLIAVYFLHRLPVPNAVDVTQRHERIPMTSADRRELLRAYYRTLIPALAFYFLLTAYRDYRDLYVAQIVKELGYDSVPAILTRIELPIAILVTSVLGLLTVIRASRTALWAIYAVMLSGMVTIGLAEFLFRTQVINGMTFMVLTGLGAYLGYVPYNAVLFERFMAATRARGNAVFGIYLADALGYGGSISLLLCKDMIFPDSSRLAFFQTCSNLISIIGAACLLLSALFLRKDLRGSQSPSRQPEMQSERKMASS